MGVVVSTAKTSPFFLTTGIIGIVSFVFTLGTFLKVVWVNLDTLSEAPHEVSLFGHIVSETCTDALQVHSYLTNLRTELLEEKASLKNMRKGMRKYQRMTLKENGGTTVGMELDDVTLKTMNDTLRHMIKQFKALEQPFLEPGERGIGDASNHRKRSRRRNSSVSPPHYDHAAYSSPPEKRARSNHDRDKEQRAKEEVDDDAYWAERTQYANFTLKRRLIWLRKKTEAQSMVEALSRVQIRRIARQVGGLTMLVHEYGCGTMELNDAVRRIDERVGRVVGVRRVD